MKRLTSACGFAGSLAFLTCPLQAAPQWIWAGKTPKDGEKVTFRKTFKLTDSVLTAQLAFTCDNGSVAYLNGTKVAENADWNSPAKADLEKLLKAGENELRFEASNEGSIAGFVATLKIETKDGKKSMIETGADWSAAPAGSQDFKPATVVAAYGAEPWGKALAGGGGGAKAGGGESVPDGAEIQVVPGF